MVKDQLYDDRILITDPLVATTNYVVGGVLVEAMNESVVPQRAWLAADVAFDEDPATVAGDELSRALVAASPHIRVQELDQLMEALTSEAEDVRNFGLRSGLRKALAILANRKTELERTIP